MNDAAVPNHNGNGYPHLNVNANVNLNDPAAMTNNMAAAGVIDPAAFMAAANPQVAAQFNVNPGTTINPAQFANPQMLAMQNGPMRNASPAFNNAMYQTNPIIPSKRPRPREDSIGQSPRQAPGMIPTSRAGTPQQSQFPGFQQQPAMGQPPTGQPNPYPHLQPNGSANATPSPIMSNQMRPGSVPQRVATASPHPFSPAAQQFPQNSPIPSDHGGTPQPNYMQQNFAQSFNPQFAQAQPPARPSPSPNPMTSQMMQQQMAGIPQQLQMHGQLHGQMGGQIPGQMGGQMGAQMSGQMPGQMGGQMGGQMPGQMPGQMAGQMAGQLPGQMPSQMVGQMPGQMPSQMAGQMQGQMFPQQMQQMPQPRNAMEQQRLMYQMQLQRQANMQMQQQMVGQNMMQPHNAAQGQAQHAHVQQAQAEARAQAAHRNLMAARGGQMVPTGMRPQQGMAQQQQQQQHPQQQPMGRGDPNSFIKNLTAFMNSKNMPLEISPVVEGRQINLASLFQLVYHKFGGYRNVTQSNGWPQITQMLGYPVHQVPHAPQHIKTVYERNILKFEEAWTAQQRARQAGVMSTPQNMQQAQPMKPMPPGQMPPNQMMSAGPQPPIQPGQMQSPMKPPVAQQPNVNGFPGAHPGQQQANAGPMGHPRNSLSRSSQPTPTAEEFPMPSPAHSKTGSMSMPGSAHPENQMMPGQGIEAAPGFPKPTRDPELYIPCSREVTTYGGVDLGSVEHFAEQLRKFKPDVPHLTDLGNIDVHALTKSIQSGIHGEVRLALDVLGTVSATSPESGKQDPPQPYLPLDLRHCDDLVETLIECAEEQVDLLAENSEEASDEITITSYEDVVRACRIEKFALRSVPLFGSQEYELDQAADRLIAITTILRNLSFLEENQACLADESVIRFLCMAIRYLGTREMLLRTQVNTLDFMKDLVILLSNITRCVEMPGREQAFCLLQFLLAFAPSPAPSMSPSPGGNDSDPGILFFTPYDPSLHPYLPHAIDSLAKLLARDEPNRTHYKTIFASESPSPGQVSPADLLVTRTFALAISPIPDLSAPNTRPVNIPSLIEVRKPFLMQGLLAADILASITPDGPVGAGVGADAAENGPVAASGGVNVARVWLSSGNGLVQNLFYLVRQLSMQYESQPVGPVRPTGRGGANQQHNKRDADLVYIVSLAVSMLRKLGEKAAKDSWPLGSSKYRNGGAMADRMDGITEEEGSEWEGGGGGWERQRQQDGLPACAVLPGKDTLLGALQMGAAEWGKEGMLKDLVAFCNLVE